MTTEEITIKAQEYKAKGSPLSIEELVAFLTKKEAKAAKAAKKSAKRWNKREKETSVRNKVASEWEKMTAAERSNRMEEMKEQSFLNQRSSSMR